MKPVLWGGGSLVPLVKNRFDRWFGVYHWLDCDLSMRLLSEVLYP